MQIYPRKKLNKYKRIAIEYTGEPDILDLNIKNRIEHLKIMMLLMYYEKNNINDIDLSELDRDICVACANAYTRNEPSTCIIALAGSPPRGMIIVPFLLKHSIIYYYDYKKLYRIDDGYFIDTVIKIIKYYDGYKPCQGKNK